MGLYSYIVLITLKRLAGLNRDQPVLGMTETGKLVLNYLVTLFELALSLLSRGQFARIWNRIQDFDEAFGLGEGRAGDGGAGGGPLKRARLCVWACLALGVLAWTVVNQLGMHAFDEHYARNVAYMLTYVGSCVSVLKLCGLVLLLGQRFAYLNGLVRERLRAREYRRADVMRKIEASYDHLLSTGEKLNDLYSWSLFLFLFNLFCHMVCNMYFFTFWTIVDATYLKNPLIVFCEFCWLIAFIIQLLLLHVACHYTSLEANLMPRILLDWRRRMYRQSKQQYEFSSTLHFLNRTLNFTTAGCFNVNLPLLTSTVGYLATYLAILVQLPGSSVS